MARLFKQMYKDRKGVTKESKKWYGEFKVDGKTVRTPLDFNKEKAAIKLQEITQEFPQNSERMSPLSIWLHCVCATEDFEDEVKEYTECQ